MRSCSLTRYCGSAVFSANSLMPTSVSKNAGSCGRSELYGKPYLGFDLRPLRSRDRTRNRIRRVVERRAVDVLVPRVDDRRSRRVQGVEAALAEGAMLRIDEPPDEAGRFRERHRVDRHLDVRIGLVDPSPT